MFLNVDPAHPHILPDFERDTKKNNLDIFPFTVILLVLKVAVLLKKGKANDYCR